MNAIVLNQNTYRSLPLPRRHRRRVTRPGANSVHPARAVDDYAVLLATDLEITTREELLGEINILLLKTAGVAEDGEIPRLSVQDAEVREKSRSKHRFRTKVARFQDRNPLGSETTKGVGAVGTSFFILTQP